MGDFGEAQGHAADWDMSHEIPTGQREVQRVVQQQRGQEDQAQWPQQELELEPEQHQEQLRWLALAEGGWLDQEGHHSLERAERAALVQQDPWLGWEYPLRGHQRREQEAVSWAGLDQDLDGE